MTFDARRFKTIGVIAVLLAAGYLLAWALYWPAYGPLSGIQEPLYYNDSYIWPVAWTMEQTAPGVPDPAPLTLRPGDTAHQSFVAAADHLAALRVWLAGARGGETVRVTLRDTTNDEGRTTDGAVRYAAVLRLHESGEGRYYNLRFPPVARAEGREFRLDVQAVEGVILARVGYVDPLPGRLYLNEYPSPGDLDMNAAHRGPPGLWTLRLVGRRLLPQVVRARVRQYKPAAFKGPVFGLLCALAAILVGAVLWAMAPPPLHPPRPTEAVGWHGGEEETRASPSPGRLKQSEREGRGGGRRVWQPALQRTVFALVGLLLAVGIAARWRPAGMLLLGPKVTLARETVPPSPVALSDSGLAVSDLVARLAFVSRDPEPRHVHARVEPLGRERRAALAVPATSAVSYGLRVPQDGELHLGLALPEGAGGPILFQVQVQGQTLLERVLTPGQAGAWHDTVLDLRPYGGASPAGGALAQVTLSTRPAGLPPALAEPVEGPPPAGTLPTAALWGAPRVTSARSWLLAEPLAEPPAYPVAATSGGSATYGGSARFGGAGDAPAAELLGADVEWLPEQGPHGALRVTHYWRALRPIYVPYTVFVHLLDGAGRIRGQWDSEPLAGTYPTDVWPAESIDGRRIIRDSTLVPTDGPLPADAYLALGLYDVATRTRLPVFVDGARLPDDRVLLEITTDE